MADLLRSSLGDRDIDQAVTALKRGACLLKYGRRGKPKFCPFRLSSDESKLIWYDGKEEKQLELRFVSKIIPGQRTAIFQRYPRPEKEYQSFSLLYSDRSLDLICKDKDEAEVWFVGLKALIAHVSYSKVKSDLRTESIASESSQGQRVSPSSASVDYEDGQQSESRWGKAFADIMAYTAATRTLSQAESVNCTPSLVQSGGLDNTNGRTSASDTMRVSLSSAVSSSSQSSCQEDIDSLGDVFIWGEGTGSGVLGGGVRKFHRSGVTMDSLLPKALESTMVLDAQSMACGSRHAVLVTRQGDIFSWGEEYGGRLGHGVETDVSNPKLIQTLSGINIEMVACGEYHTCAVTLAGDLYSWGDGNFNSGLLGHESVTTHTIPKKVSGLLEGIRVSYVSCGLWHTALITSAGQLYTFGDGTFGALGHGDHNSIRIPREVETLRDCRTVRVACGVWHTAAVVEVESGSSSSPPPEGSIPGKLFTWGDGDKGQLGHGDKKPRIIPESVAALVDVSFSKVACGNNITIGVTTSGRLYTMGSNVYGQLGTLSDGKTPTCIEGRIADSFVEEIACGSYHVAVLTSKTEIYTWGKGANGQLGHGDYIDRHTPTLVDFFKDRQVKGVVCGSNFTAAICIHKSLSYSDNTLCSGCRNPFNFIRKRHNCYNCGLVFCKACSSKKSLKASLAPSSNKLYRVCDDCHTKIQKTTDAGSPRVISQVKSWAILSKNSELGETEAGGPPVQGQLSKLFSLNSLSLGEGINTKKSMKTETRDNRMIQCPVANTDRQSLSCAKAPGPLFGASMSCLSLSVPNSRMVSQTSSPVKGKTVLPQFPSLAQSLPPITAKLIFDDPKQNNECVSQEFAYLQAQVEDLAKNSQSLEVELEKKSRQLEVATTLAADEAEKCKAAKEVIKSLTTQLKEMSERVSERHASSNRDSNSEVSNDTSHEVDENIKGNLSPPKSEADENSTQSSLSNGSKVQSETTEWVVQYDPGVYITLSSLPGGGTELRRVRFSRKCFTEQQAENWWAENETRVCEEHNILKLTK